MLPTPPTSHINSDRVYEPAEDSYLLLDTISSPTEIDFLRTRFPNNSDSPLMLEVGTGSGVVLAFVTAQANEIFGRSDVQTLGVDVNRFACLATRQTVELAVQESKQAGKAPGLFLDCVVGDLATSIMPGSVDILIFNPPYVPSEGCPSMPEDRRAAKPEEVFARDWHLLSLATDGGKDGMATTNRLLGQLSSVMNHRGVAYVLLCAQNKPQEVIASVRAWTSWAFPSDFGIWSADVVGSSGKKAGWERLCVVRIWREGALYDPKNSLENNEHRP